MQFAKTSGPCSNLATTSTGGGGNGSVWNSGSSMTLSVSLTGSWRCQYGCVICADEGTLTLKRTVNPFPNRVLLRTSDFQSGGSRRLMPALSVDVFAAESFSVCSTRLPGTAL